MKIESLDHVALWVADRDILADFMTRHLGMHVIERTDAFTIVGAHARRGKLTLFAAEGARQPGPLARVALRVRDLSEALDNLPTEPAVTHPAPKLAAFTAPEDLELGLIEAAGEEYDLDHVVLRVTDPDEAFAALSTLGFTAEDARLRAGAPGNAHLELQQGDEVNSERPLLNHLGLRVESAAEHIAEAEERGLDIADVVDAPNTYALFVWGPDRLKLEYVEHKESFSLA